MNNTTKSPSWDIKLYEDKKRRVYKSIDPDPDCLVHERLERLVLASMTELARQLQKPPHLREVDPGLMNAWTRFADNIDDLPDDLELICMNCYMKLLAADRYN